MNTICYLDNFIFKNVQNGTYVHIGNKQTFNNWTGIMIEPGDIHLLKSILEQRNILNVNYLYTENDIQLHELNIYVDVIEYGTPPASIPPEYEMIYDRNVFIHKQSVFHRSFHKVALLCNWTSGYQLAKQYLKMRSKESRIILWDLLDVKPKYPDYWVIINYSEQYMNIDLSKTIVFEMEPIRLWSSLTSNEHLFFRVCSHEKTYNNLEWHLNLTMDQIYMPIEKSEEIMISTVLSGKYFDPGHIKRINFVKYIEQTIDIDVFGTNAFNYKRYRGALPVYEKNNGLFPYKYHFNAENNAKPNYFTEKIVDAILSECLCFYWGCPNISEYIDPRAYIVLDLDDFEKSVQIIREAIEKKEWENRIDIIRKEKLKIMTELSFFPRLEEILNTND